LEYNALLGVFVNFVFKKKNENLGFDAVLEVDPVGLFV
jgi:hypothetical protein